MSLRHYIISIVLYLLQRVFCWRLRDIGLCFGLLVLKRILLNNLLVYNFLILLLLLNFFRRLFVTNFLLRLNFVINLILFQR